MIGMGLRQTGQRAMKWMLATRDTQAAPAWSGRSRTFRSVDSAEQGDRFQDDDRRVRAVVSV